MRKSNFKTVILYVVLISVVLLVATQLLGEASPKDELTTQDIFGYFERGEVKSFELDQDANLEIILNDEKGTEISARLLDYELFRDKIFIPFILDNPENTVEYNLKEPTQIPWWVEFLPYVVIFVLFSGFWIFMKLIKKLFHLITLILSVKKNLFQSVIFQN